MIASATLLHPEKAFTVTAFQAMNKCSLFQNNPILLVSPYRVQSPVSLSIFRESVSALEENAIKITDTDFKELQRLCEEFGFEEFAAKLSKFSQPSEDSQKRQIRTSCARMQGALLSESFLFFAKGAEITSDVAETIALSRAVRDQLSIDGRARKSVVNESEIEAEDIRSLQLLLSREEISVRRSQEFSFNSRKLRHPIVKR
jgi:hypothetical protein